MNLMVEEFWDEFEWAFISCSPYVRHETMQTLMHGGLEGCEGRINEMRFEIMWQHGLK